MAGVLVVPAGRVLLVASRRARASGLLEMLGPLRHALLVVLVVIHWERYPVTVMAAFMPPP